MDKEQVKAILAEAMIRPQRSLGQNFLAQAAVAEKIVAATAAGPADLVLEIGPGIGALTLGLAASAGRLIALEIDQRLVPILRKRLDGQASASVIQADALKIDLASLAGNWPGPVLVTASLPYYITTPLLEKILVELPACRQLCLLVQKEAAERLRAGPATKDYGPAAILLALAGQTRRLFNVPATAFYPQPHITSSVILTEITPVKANGLPVDVAGRRHFLQFLKACFQQRRKKLRHNLPPGQDDLLSRAGLADDLRAEELEPEDFLRLWQLLGPDGQGLLEPL